jgi:hypothetical protein
LADWRGIADHCTEQARLTVRKGVLFGFLPGCDFLLASVFGEPVADLGQCLSGIFCGHAGQS